MKPFHHSQLRCTFYSILLTYSVKRIHKIVIILLHSGSIHDTICNLPQKKLLGGSVVMQEHTTQSLHHLSGNDKTQNITQETRGNFQCPW
jgi:hypothetical protein